VEVNGERELRAPTIISDAGVINTFEKLVPSELAQSIGYASKTRDVQASVAHLSLYVGLKGTTEELGLEKTNLWVYPNHRHEENFERFLADMSAPLPVAYLSFPSAKDPDFQRRYPGHSTIETVTLGSYDAFKRWENTSWKKRGAEYDELKASLSERLLDVIYKHAPGTRGHVEIAELSTPLSTQNFAAHRAGAIYGISHDANRFEQRWLRPRTPIKGLYLTGADVCTAGVAGAMMGGLICSSAVLKGNVLGQVLKHQAQTLRDKAPAPPKPARA
jgi:all-trans-retinol 13,14-reductase